MKMFRRHATVMGIVLGAGIALSLVVITRGQAIQSGQVFAEPPVPPRDRAANLAMKITSSFTVASVGDVMVKRPAASLTDPVFQNAFQIIRDADIGFGNMEGNLSDIKTFDGPLRGMMGSKEVAPSLKALGFDMMNRANNHIFDSDREGMFSTMAQLDGAGIVHAGTGKNLEDARAPAYLDTPKGRVALVGMHTPHGTSNANASYQTGNIGGRPGLNPLNYTTYFNVTAEQMAALKAIRKAAYTAPQGTTNAVRLPDNEPADRVQLFGVWYKVGQPGTKSFEMDADDLREILRSIRNGKYLSDFEIVTIHAHQGPVIAQQWLFEDLTPEFLVDFAHKAIDSGADMFVGHGPHVLRGVEIYKGKPIFYGMGEFFYEWQHMDASLMSGSWASSGGRGGRGGRGAAVDDNAVIDVANAVSATWRPVNFESMIAQSRFDKGRLVEVRLYPISGGWDGPVSQLGIPRMAPPDLGQKILTRVQALSKAFGTTVAIEGNVGVIRVAQTTQTSSGQQQ
jgi:poly-gamma-glutamate capsule biosynthesis protein CapA/YwtB (metallophosphatase superfamily)